jgi:C4-dicarboxylate transporter
MAARANNAFMRLPSPRLAYLGRSVSEIAGMVLLVAGPAALSIVIAIAAKSLGFP